MNLSEIEQLDTFALLSPGFGGRKFILCTDLRPSVNSGNLVIQPYQGEAQWFATTAREIDLNIDTTLPFTIHHSPFTIHSSPFIKGVEAIRNKIAAGDVYQVNLTMRVRIGEMSGAEIFAKLCKQSSVVSGQRLIPKFAAYCRLPPPSPEMGARGDEIVSASPEMFFEIRGGILHCQPMKGTAKSSEKEWLMKSEKDIAELAMITDLVRNDMTPLCQPRSVEVIHERKLIDLGYVIQAVSDIEGTLLENMPVSEILKNLHPCGSVTGAPKRAAIDMIKQLETTPRGYYCGSIGFIQGNNAIFSILIRTAFRHGKEWLYGTGGGVVWDSVPELELEEAKMKLGALMN